MLSLKALFFVIGSFCIASSVQEPVKLELYYEGLCPYCHEFIFDQLYPGYQKLGDKALLVDLIPFGNAYYRVYAVNDTVEFTCQHGPEECLINRIHACAIDENPTQQDLLHFINCHLNVTNHDEPLNAARQCAFRSEMSFDNINACVVGDRGDELLIAYATRQMMLNPELPYVPNIRFNGVFNKDLENSARHDFVTTICQLLEGEKPDICNNTVQNSPPHSFKPETCQKKLH